MIPNRSAGQRLESAEEEEGMSCAVRVGFSPRGARAIQYAVASATDDDKAVKPLGKQILEVFSCRSNKISAVSGTGLSDSLRLHFYGTRKRHQMICSLYDGQ